MGSYSWCYSIVVSYGLQGQGSFNYISRRVLGGRERGSMTIKAKREAAEIRIPEFKGRENIRKKVAISAPNATDKLTSISLKPVL